MKVQPSLLRRRESPWRSMSSEIQPPFFHRKKEELTLYRTEKIGRQKNGHLTPYIIGLRNNGPAFLKAERGEPRSPVTISSSPATLPSSKARGQPSRRRSSGSFGNQLLLSDYLNSAESKKERSPKASFKGRGQERRQPCKEISSEEGMSVK